MAASDGGNAMTEIALALAMAFFAIMILTMVSMGGQGRANDAIPVKSVRQPLQVLPSASQADGKGEDGKEIVPAPGQLVILVGGQFLDDQLRPLAPQAVSAMEHPVLAVTPETSLAQVMSAKDRLDHPDLTVTTLDQHWIDAIKEIAK